MTELQKGILREIHAHAIEEYPIECCGIITGNMDSQTIHRCENIQNILHAEDPVRYPRDARIAYGIDRKEFERIISSARKQGEDVLAFYHSHPDHEAFFSREDTAAQTVFGAPEFPDALQIVVSVMKGKIHDTQCFIWEQTAEKFTTVQLPE